MLTCCWLLISLILSSALPCALLLCTPCVSLRRGSAHLSSFFPPMPRPSLRPLLAVSYYSLLSNDNMRLIHDTNIISTSSSGYRDCLQQQRPLVSLLSADIFLLVIAHPDDECMFFIPTIVNLISTTQSVFHILCLSNGNYEGLGKQREKELHNAVRTLGLDTHQVTVLTDFQDNPLLDWNDQLLSDCIYRHILYILSVLQGSVAAPSKEGQHLKTLTILTFDSKGVSGHRNHCSTYR